MIAAGDSDGRDPLRRETRSVRIALPRGSDSDADSGAVGGGRGGFRVRSGSGRAAYERVKQEM